MYCKTAKNPLYKYYVKYPFETDGTCSVCGCKMRIVYHNTQQQTAKLYCRKPCSAKRMASVTVLWAESWPKKEITTADCEQQDYIAMLRKSKGITQEVIDGINRE